MVLTCQLGEALRSTMPDSAFIIAENVLQEAERTGSVRAKIRAIELKSVLYREKGDLPTAVQLALNGLELARQHGLVIGDAVNVAQRLQAAAATGQILISEACYEKVKQSFNFRKIGSSALKNKEKEIVLYEVLD